MFSKTVASIHSPESPEAVKTGSVNKAATACTVRACSAPAARSECVVQ